MHLLAQALFLAAATVHAIPVADLQPDGRFSTDSYLMYESPSLPEFGGNFTVCQRIRLARHRGPKYAVVSYATAAADNAIIASKPID